MSRDLVSRATTSVMSELEWDEGITMPVANDENKNLENVVQKLQQTIVQYQGDLNDNDDRVGSMLDHTKNVRQELSHTQQLCQAREREVETEKHMSQIARREEGRLKQEVQRLENELADLKEKRNLLENNIFKQTQQLEEIKNQMNWDQQALEAWLEESARKDEDFMTLARYTRMDEAKIKELSLRIERLTDDNGKKRKMLDHEMTETLTAQLELDKTAEEFRKLHNERQDLISQWELTIDQMKKRDREMNVLAIELQELKSDVREREAVLTERVQFYDNECSNNGEKEKYIRTADRTAAKLRLEYQDIEKSRIQFQDELETLKNTVDRTATDLHVMRGEVNNIRGDVQEKSDRLENAKEMRVTLQGKLKMTTEYTLTAEERAAKMDELLREEDSRIQDIQTELHRLREIEFKKAQELFKCQQLEKNQAAEIQGSYAATRNLNSKINRLDQDTLKQQELIYNQDFQIQQLERRIMRMQGERSNEEKDILEQKIRDLNNVLEAKNAKHQLLGLQLKHLQDDVRRVKRDLETTGAEKTDLTVKIEELDLHNDSSQKELKKTITNKQDLMVDENIIKLEVKRLRDLLNMKADDVMTLEKRQLQLETAMKERRQEIDIHKDMLRAQIKSSEEERQTISSELYGRIAKIDKLRKRYEILMVQMSPPEGEEEKTAAYYVIKAAQEKEELQREGDDLDAKIRKAEKEIRALENTVRLMNGRNEQYRKSFNKITETSEELDEKENFEDQMRAIMDKYKYKRRQIRELQEDIQAMDNTLDTLTRDKSAYAEIIQEKDGKFKMVNKELDDLTAKLSRARRQCAKYAREIRQSKQATGETLEERDFELRDLRDFNKKVMQQMADATKDYPDALSTINLYFTQAGIPPPTPPGSRSGSSARSSISGSSLGSARSQTSVRSSSSVTKKTVPSFPMAPRTPVEGELSIAGAGLTGRTPPSSRPPSDRSGSSVRSSASRSSSRK